MKDVGKPKSQVAAEFINKRCPSVKCTWYQDDITKKPRTWYRQFNVVISGLDNIEARAWLNETLVDLVKFDKNGEVDWDTAIPMIDGGTEGFNGQSRYFLSRRNGCFTCSLASMAEATSFAICTIRNVPRTPEHCIAYALKIGWPHLTEFKSATDFKYSEPADSDTKNNDEKSEEGAVPLDKDNVEHMTWLYNMATQRAKKYNISGVTYSLTMQVVKNIIPAIASTNALISAACANEAFKHVTGCSQLLNNYMMYMGGKAGGINAEVFKYQKTPRCKVCQDPIFLKLDKSTKFSDVLAKLEGGAGGKRGPLGAILTLANQLTFVPYYVSNSKGAVIQGGALLDKPISEVFPEGAEGLLLSCTAANLGDDVQKVWLMFK